MKHVIKVNDIQEAIQRRIRPIVAKDLNNKLYISTKMPPLMKTIFHYSDGSTSESSDTVITKSSYESQIPEGASLISVEIGNNVTSIGDNAFKGCTGLTSVTISDSVTSIGVQAFSACFSLASVVIPSSVTSIGDSAFDWCSSLTTVIIEEGLVSLGYTAFYNCKSLTTINIPNSLRYANNPFMMLTGTSSISSILYNSHIFVYMPASYSGEYIIPNGIETIAGGAFDGCGSLTAIEIPNSVTSIGEWAFRTCVGLTTITIPNSVESIGHETFNRCDNLSNIIIGTEPSLTRLSYIGEYAFLAIYYSSTITCNAIEPPKIDKSAGFDNSFTIYVPTQSVDAYKAATNWSEYADRIFPIQ